VMLMQKYLLLSKERLQEHTLLEFDSAYFLFIMFIHF
jgi:hypothetical protein